MTTPLDQLLAVLDEAGVHLSPREVAEAIWLALRVDVSPGRRGSPPLAGDEAEVPLRLPATDAEAPDAREPEVTPEPAPRPAEPFAAPAQATVELEAVPGWPLLVRTAAALPHSGRTMRALRALKRRLPSDRSVVIDEDATARRIAERGIRAPVWRPAPDRWLNLTLVLDHSSVGGVWDRLGYEVRALLERLGAFRTMRVVHLGLRGDGTLGVLRPAAAGHSPLRLADRPGRQLFLVLSDCVSAPWHDGEMSRLLGHWGRRAPVAILQPLPERLWSRTGLAPLAGRLHTPEAGAPCSAYSFDSALRRRRLPGGSVPVPVLELDPGWLSTWANLVVGRAPGGIDAVVTAAGAPARNDPAREGTGGPDAERRVRGFRAGASAPAYELARYLSAAVPLNLAVMRMVQDVMVPGSRPSHLAEVLYGGLLRPESSGGAGADDQQFEFLPGVRHLLMDTLRQSDAGRVYREVSDFVQRHLERTGASFTAVVSAPMSSLTVPALQQPFAGVRAEVLRRLAKGATGPILTEAPVVTRTRERLTILHVRDPEAAVGDADLVVVAGGIAPHATRAEYQAAYQKLAGLGRVVVVPGVSDVSDPLCRRYFAECAADEQPPIPPYWPKWEPYAGFVAQLDGEGTFEPDQPWQLHEIPELSTVVAAFNSTVPISHLPGERGGGLGEEQIAWFTDRLRDYAGRGWLRVGVVHHELGGAERLASCLDVVLHGQPGGVREIGVTGVPAVGLTGRAQLVGLRPGSLRVGPGVLEAYGDHWWLAENGVPLPPRGVDDPGDPSRDDLAARIARAYRARHPGVSLIERDRYLVASSRGDRRLIGFVDGEPGEADVERFAAAVARQAEPGRETALLVCRGLPDAALREAAAARGVRLVDLRTFQLGDDIAQFAGTAPGSDSGYVSPPFTVLSGADSVHDLPALLSGRLDEHGDRMVGVTGPSGAGKSSLLREIARLLRAADTAVVPILVDLRTLDWRVGLEQLVAIQLARGGLREVDPDRARYLLREGLVVLLCDGLDDLAARTARNDRSDGWPVGVQPLGSAKVVLVSRDPDLLDEAFAPYATPDGIYRVRLDDFGPRHILDFLTRRLGAERAQARVDRLGRVGRLLAMARNPRMLAFIAGLDDESLSAAASGGADVTVAALYQSLIADLLGEPAPATRGDLRQALSYLARRLWESGESALGADALGAAADILTRLSGARGGATPGRGAAARLLGAGSLLVRDQDYRFRFVDDSILEWFVARDIAAQIAQGRPVSLPRRELSPLTVEFVCDLAGRDRAGEWARATLASRTAPAELLAAAAQVLDQL